MSSRILEYYTQEKIQEFILKKTGIILKNDNDLQEFSKHLINKYYELENEKIIK